MLIADQNFYLVNDREWSTVYDDPTGFLVPGLPVSDAIRDATPKPKRLTAYDVAGRVDVNQTPLPSRPELPRKPVYFAGDDPYDSVPSQPFLRNNA